MTKLSGSWAKCGWGGLRAGVLAVALAGWGLLAGGCWPFGSEPDPEIPVMTDEWNGPNYDGARPLPGDTKLLIASHRMKGSENWSEALYTMHSTGPETRTDEEVRRMRVMEKVLYQGKTLPTSMGTNIATPFSMDMTEIQEEDQQHYRKSVYENGREEVDTALNGGAVSFGANDVPILSGGLVPMEPAPTSRPAPGATREPTSGFTTLALDTRRYPIARVEERGGEPKPFRIDGDRLHYLLPHFPPVEGAGGGQFPPGGTWRDRLPVYYPLTTLDPSMLDACRFMLTVSHTLEGYRQGPDQILARVHYTFEGSFDSKDPETAKRFPHDWGTKHVIYDKMTGEGTAIIDVGHGEILWRKETMRLELKEAHLVPPDPANKVAGEDPNGHWEKSERVITHEFLIRREFPRTVTPPELH